jgi:transketolase
VSDNAIVHSNPSGETMANKTDTEDKQTTEAPASGKSLLDQVQGELNKQQREAIKGKLKDKLAKRNEHQKAINQINKEIQDLLDDHEAGVL